MLIESTISVQSKERYYQKLYKWYKKFSIEKMTMLILFNAIDVTQNSRAYLLSKISASCLILELLHLKLSSKKNYVAIKKVTNNE